MRTPQTHDLQAQLDNITMQTRSLVQPERLAVTDAAVNELLATGIEDRILPVGALAPNFSLPGATAISPHSSSPIGKLIRSIDLLALGPLIVNFFRGRWCPYCMTELEVWQAAFPAVRGRGALLVAISPQTPRQNDFTAQQHSLTFPLLSDAGARVASAFGIAYHVPELMQRHYRSILVNIPLVHGDQGADTWCLPLPATFAIKPSLDAEGHITGTIAFAEAHADHRVRPDPRDVLATL